MEDTYARQESILIAEENIRSRHVIADYLRRCGDGVLLARSTGKSVRELCVACPCLSRSCDSAEGSGPYRGAAREKLSAFGTLCPALRLASISTGEGLA